MRLDAVASCCFFHTGITLEHYASSHLLPPAFVKLAGLY